ncbi:GNAT family N-acetyltransferase [Streptomyces dysideae]|nr:GNAT family N-acetyltransferase [Streptomyces dysideae]
MTVLVTLVLTGQENLALVIVLPIGAVFVIVAAPPRIVLILAAVVALVSPTAWPSMGDLGGATVRLGDLLVLLIGITCLVRPRPDRHMPVLRAMGALLIFGVLRSSLAGGIPTVSSFLRVMEFVVAGAALGLFLPRGFDVWRRARWVLLGVLVTVPLSGYTSTRWSGLPGGPNEVALLAAVLVVLGFAEGSKPVKCLLVFSGLLFLFGSRGIAASAGGLVGLAVLSMHRRGHFRWRSQQGRINPLVVIGVAVGTVFVLPVIRPDMGVTLKVHSLQATSFGPAFAATNPLVGGGWSLVNREALVDAYRQTNIMGLHNVYLCMAVFLGAIGLAMFLMLLWCAWRHGDRVTRAVLVTVAVWFNTIGAFPGAGWGILGLVVAACASQGANNGERPASCSGLRMNTDAVDAFPSPGKAIASRGAFRPAVSKIRPRTAEPADQVEWTRHRTGTKIDPLPPVSVRTLPEGRDTPKECTESCGSARLHRHREPLCHARAIADRTEVPGMHGTDDRAAVSRPGLQLHCLGAVMEELLSPLTDLERRVHRKSSYYDEEPWQAENFAQELPGKRELSLVATDSGRPVGFVIASRKPDGTHIHRVATDPDLWGTGIASRLLTRVLTQAPGTTTLVCDPRNKPALALYTRAGFHIAGTTPDGKLSLATGTALPQRVFSERKT